MSTSSIHTAYLTLANGQRITVKVTVSGGPAVSPDRDLVPLAEVPATVVLVVDGDTASPGAVGQALLDLIYAGEAAQRASAASAADLAAVIAEAEAARDGRAR